MQIEITEKRSKDFYKESINVANQFKSLLKKPEGKVRDYYKDFSLYIIGGIVLLMLLLLVTLAYGFDWLMAVAFALSIVLIGFGAVYLANLMKILNSLYSNQTDTTFTMDKDGVGISITDEKDVKISWNKLYFARALKHSVAFVPKDYTTFVISVPVCYKSEVMEYIKENKPEIKFIQ